MVVFVYASSLGRNFVIKFSTGVTRLLISLGLILAGATYIVKLETSLIYQPLSFVYSFPSFIMISLLGVILLSILFVVSKLVTINEGAIKLQCDIIYTNILLVLFIILTYRSSSSNFLPFAFTLMCFFIIYKLLFNRGNYLVFLILIELLMLIAYITVASLRLAMCSSSLSLFILMCLIVSGACLGMAALVAVSRSFGKEMEIFFMKMQLAFTLSFANLRTVKLY